MQSKFENWKKIAPQTIAGFIWLAAGWLNVSLNSSFGSKPFSKSGWPIEWALIGALMIASSFARYRGSLISTLIGIPTLVFSFSIALLAVGPFPGRLRLAAGGIFTIGSFTVYFIATVRGLFQARQGRGLTKQGIKRATPFLTFAVAWAIAYGPSWLVAMYFLPTRTFQVSNSHYFISAYGNIFSEVGWNNFCEIVVLVAPVTVVMWSSLFRDFLSFLYVQLSVGLLMISVTTDQFWNLGAQSRSYAPSWAGWSMQGQIHVQGTIWLWIAFGAAIVLAMSAVAWITWLRAEN